MSTLPITQNLLRKRGDTKPFPFTIADPDGTATDLTGFSFLLTVNSEQKPIDATNQLFQLVGTSSAAGSYSFTPNAAQTDRLGKVFYDVQMTDPLGLIYTVVEGSIKFTQDITK